MVVSYSNQAIAGGMTQGVLPLIGYNYASKNYSRMRSAVKTAFLYSVVIAVAGTVLLFTCAVPVVRSFISDEETVVYGQHFLRIICLTCPAVSATPIADFLAMGIALCLFIPYGKRFRDS